jgi:hypothetical protein
MACDISNVCSTSYKLPTHTPGAEPWDQDWFGATSELDGLPPYDYPLSDLFMPEVILEVKL